jgi:hypothetical protein
MSLTVNVAVTGTIDNNNQLQASATYSQGASTPPSTGVVDAGGDINLTQMSDPNNQYSNQTDITFILSGTVTGPNGQSYAVEYPSPVGSAIALQKQNGGPPNSGEFIPSLQSSTSLLLDDANSDGQDYNYCLVVTPDMLDADGNPTCRLDPNIVNR